MEDVLFLFSSSSNLHEKGYFCLRQTSPCSVMGLLNDYQRDFKIRAFSVSQWKPSLSQKCWCSSIFPKESFRALIYYRETTLHAIIILFLNMPGRFALGTFTFLRYDAFSLVDERFCRDWTVRIELWRRKSGSQGWSFPMARTCKTQLRGGS